MILGYNQEENASNFNKNSYLHEATFLKCNKRLVNKRKLTEDEKAAPALFNSKHLAHVWEYFRTRQDIPCKYCAWAAYYVDLSIENTQNKLNENDCALKRNLRQRS